MQKSLAGRKVAILVGNGFDEIQMTDCQRALLGAGATVKIVSTAPGLVNGWNGKGWGHYYQVDQQVSETLAADFDMLFLPGGERSLTKLMETAHTLRIVRGFRDADKPIAAIGSGVTLLVKADRLTGAEISIPETGHEMAAAVGARIGAESSTTDGNLLTATYETDFPAFMENMLALFAAPATMKSAA